MKRTILVCCLLGLLAACGKDNSQATAELKKTGGGDTGGGDKTPAQVNSQVYATWLGPVQSIPMGDSRTLNIQVKLKVEPNHVSGIAVCTVPQLNITETAVATSVAQISPNEIDVESEASAKKDLDVAGTHIDCTASVAKGSLNYEVSGSTLTLKDPKTGLSFSMQKE